MKITILTYGTRGDVQPYIALGLGLQQAGFTVQIATHGIYADFITRFGLDFAPVEGNPQQLLESAVGQQWLNSNQNPLKFAQYLIKLTRPHLDRVFRDSVVACRGSDVILYSLLGIVGFHVAEALQIPGIMTMLQPFDPTTSFPSTGMPPKLSRGGWLNYFSHVAAVQVLWQPFRQQVNDWRQRELNLAKRPFFGNFLRQSPQRTAVLYGYSPSVLPKPKEWGKWIHVTGYWFLDEARQWEPPASLLAFLQAGPPPVYLGFGSMRDRDPEGLQRILLTAVQRAGLRAVLLSGWAGLAAANVPESVYVIDAVPHDWLFPHMAAVVHHGGAGTTAAGLRAGVPNIVVPYFADQHFWGERVYRLGAGPRPVPRARLTVDKLTAALQQATQNQTMQQAAQQLGAAIRAERGVETAVAHLQQILQKQEAPSISPR